MSRLRNNSMAFRKQLLCVAHTPVTMLFGNARVVKDPYYFIFKYWFGASPQSWLYVFLLSIFFLWNSGSCGFPVYGRRSTWQSEMGNAQRLLKIGLKYCWWSLFKWQECRKKEYVEKAGRCSDLWEEVETLGHVLIDLADTNYVCCARQKWCIYACLCR